MTIANVENGFCGGWLLRPNTTTNTTRSKRDFVSPQKECAKARFKQLHATTRVLGETK